MKKLFYFTTFIFLLLLPILVCSACSSTDTNSISTSNDTYLLPYVIDDSGQVIKFYANESNSTDIEIPSSYSLDIHGNFINGKVYKITGIGKYSFANNNLVKTIHIPSSITSIDNYAFYNCPNLEKINIPNSVLSIQSNAINSCPKLTNIINNTKENGLFVEQNNNLESFSIPSSITTIKDNSFSNWTNLQSITISDNIEYIGNNCFNNCENLQKVVFNSSNLSYLADNAFSNCTLLTTLNTTSNSNSHNSISFTEIPSIKKYVVPSSITKIENYTFNNWTNLEVISIPENITQPSYIFKNNINLKILKCGNNSILQMFSPSTDNSTNMYVFNIVLPPILIPLVVISQIL